MMGTKQLCVMVLSPNLGWDAVYTADSIVMKLHYHTSFNATCLVKMDTCNKLDYQRKLIIKGKLFFSVLQFMIKEVVERNKNNRSVTTDISTLTLPQTREIN